MSGSSRGKLPSTNNQPAAGPMAVAYRRSAFPKLLPGNNVLTCLREADHALIGLEMPLVSDPKSKPLPHSNSRAIGFWMSVEGRTPIQTVRVLVSFEALSG